jgi:endonuclease/exonuclease/phosphatase family metal-dependent hydrolase
VPLKVLTLNLWNASGPWPERAKRIREWIDRLEPDVIGFQEAVRQPGFDQVPELLEGRGYHLDYVGISAFWRAGREAEAGEVGNAIASRFPIVERAELPLPESGDGEKRAALRVVVAAPAGRISVTVTHLNWKLDHGWVRERQVVPLCDFAAERADHGEFPPLLLGDFNAEPDSTEVRYVQGLHAIAGNSVCFLDAWRTARSEGPGITWDNANPWAAQDREPDRRIDYVFAGLPPKSGLGQVLACRVVCNDERDGIWPSDHFGVYAELRDTPVAD